MPFLYPQALFDRSIVSAIHHRKLATGVANGTDNRTLALLRAIFLPAAHDWEWIDSTPKVRLLREPLRRISFLTRAQAVRLLHELPEHLSDMAAFSLSTGLRKTNVTRLDCFRLI